MKHFLKMKDLLGLTLTDINVTDNEIIFIAGERKIRMFHSQDCCESVYIESIVGDVNDLI